jgi:hypothetical protein
MGTLAYIDHLLRNRDLIIANLRDGPKCGQITRTCFKVFLMLTVLYGLIMGSQSLMHGHWAGWMYSVAAATKLPLLFMLTLVICMPLVYVLNVLIGAREQFRVIFGLLVSSVAVTSVLLASCAPILAFFMLSTKSYAFIKFLNVVIFAIAGLYGVWYLGRGMQMLAAKCAEERQEPQANVKTIITWWMVTYGIVGTQMAWMMRPFIGHEGSVFTFFRPQESNFYIEVGKVLAKLFSGG